MPSIPALIQRMGSEHIDLKQRIITSLAENPFLDTEVDALSVRFGHPQEWVTKALEDLFNREILVQTGWGGPGLSPSEDVYAAALRLTADLGPEKASLRRQIYEIETAERLKQKLAVSQREVEAVLEIVPAGVLIFDQHGRLLKSNPAARMLLGLGNRAHGEDHLWEALGVTHGKASGGPSGLTLSEMVAKPGEHRWELDRTPPLEVVSRPFTVGPRGNGLILTIRDISDRRSAEESCARMREDFFSMIRHELLKPLLGIERALGVFGQEGWVEEAERDALLDNARMGMRRLKGMIDDMLLLARLERDPLAVTPKDQVMLTLLLTSSALSFRDRAQEMGLTLNADIPDDEVVFPGDEKRLLQVIENLMDNALKFTPPGGAITLSGRRLRGAGAGREDERPQEGDPSLRGSETGAEAEWVEVAVADTGIGIPPEEQGQIFGKFYQVQQGMSRREGLGLGLAICQQIVAAHRGRITLESKPGHGTKVRMMLPIAGASSV